VLFLSLSYGGIEEEYKTIKCAIEEESFTGKTPLVIYQEFYASLILSNLQVIINREKNVQDEINLKSIKWIYDYQENRTSALYLERWLFIVYRKLYRTNNIAY